jgi:hypothetical protein
MKQPKYRFEDLHFESDRSYTDINEVIVGFLIDNDLVIDCDNKEKLTEIVNNMLAEHYEKTQHVLYPSDFEISMSVEMNTRTNRIIINTYIYNANNLHLHTTIDIDTLNDSGKMQKYFFNTLSSIVFEKIRELQKAARVTSKVAV